VSLNWTINNEGNDSDNNDDDGNDDNNNDGHGWQITTSILIVHNVK
jgi:hypothetical protein